MLHKNLYTALTQLSGAVENLSRSSSSFADTKEDILKKKKKTKKKQAKESGSGGINDSGAEQRCVSFHLDKQTYSYNLMDYKDSKIFTV